MEKTVTPERQETKAKTELQVGMTTTPERQETKVKTELRAIGCFLLDCLEEGGGVLFKLFKTQV